MAGILDYRNYLNTLQTATFVGNIFPSDQKTMNFELPGGGVDGWTAEISWMTLIIDYMTWNSNQIPNFTETSIFGYYLGGTASQVSNGVISIPAGMYDGPILPTQEYHVPITVVNVRWTKNGETYAQNLAWIQNWEPGVLLGDPIYGDGFIPIVKEASTLTLSGPGAVVWQSNLTLIATTDIPIDLGPFATAYFFWDKPGGRVLLGTANFNAAKQAILNYDTSGTSPLVPGTYPIYAEFSGVRQYGFQRSNTVNQLISGLTPLVLEQESFTPNQSTFNIGDTLQYYVKFRPDPSYPQSGNAVNNAARVYRKDIATAGLPNPPNQSDVLLTATNFINGGISVTQPITSDLVDTSTYFTYADNFTITTSTIENNVFYYTADVSNTYEFYTSWDVDTAGPYAAGNYSGRDFTVETTVSRNIPGQQFPMTLTWAASNLGFSNTADWPSIDEMNAFLRYLKAGSYQPSTGQINRATATLGLAFYIINYELVAFKPSRTFVPYPGPTWLDISGYEAYRTQLLNDYGGTFYGQTATFTISTPRAFGSAITLTANDGSTSTVLGTIPGNIEGGGGPKQINSNVLTTGTWTVVATFPGDLGLSIDPRYCNLASTSNQVTLTIRQGNDLPVTLQFNRTETQDIITAVTPILSTLVRDVSFYYGESFINTSSWNIGSSTATIVSTSTLAPIEYYSVKNAQQQFLNPVVDPVTGATFNPVKEGWGIAQNIPSVPWNGTYDGATFPATKWPNAWTLFRYKSPNESTSSYLASYWEPVSLSNTTASVGTNQGYNVIGLNTYNNSEKPLIPAWGRKLKFNNYGMGSNTTEEREITLVEYIGEKDGIWFYRFTPEIPQTNNIYNVAYPYGRNVPDAAWTGNPSGFSSIQNRTAINLSDGSAWIANVRRLDGYWGWAPDTSKPNSSYNIWYQTWLNFAKKNWISANTNDPVLNEKAKFNNMWWNTFANRSDAVVTLEEVTTSTILTYENKQIAQISLPVDTIVDPEALRATWPGTLDLPIANGRWNPFDIGVGLPASSVTLLPTFDLVVCGGQGGVDGRGNYLGNAWTKPNKTSNAIYDNNDYYLTALIELQPSILGTSTQALEVTGNVEFINQDTGVTIGYASAVTEVPKGYEYYQAVARLAVNASDIVNTAGNNQVRLIAKYTAGNVSTSTSDTVVAQVVKSSFSMVPFTYTNNPQRLDMAYHYGGFEPTDSVIGEIINSPVAILEKSDYVGRTGDVIVNGRIEYIFPALNYRGKNYVGDARIDDYPGNEGGNQFQTDFYGSNSTLYAQFRVGLFYELETYSSTSTGLITLANTTQNYFDQRLYSSFSPSTIVGKNIYSRIGNLTWNDNWVRIKIYQRVATYFFVGTTPYVSCLGLAARLGFNPNLTL